MPTAPVPTTGSFIGFGKETTPGTVVTATTFMPVLTFGPHDMYHYVPDKNYRGSAVENYDQIATQRWAEYSFSGDVFADVIGTVFQGLLGDRTDTGTASPYTHTWSVLNTITGGVNLQPTSYSIVDYNGFNARAFGFGKFDEFSFKFEADKLTSYTAKAQAFASSTVTKPTQSFSAQRVKPAYEGATTLGGTATSLMASGEVTIKRSVEPVLTVNGTQDPYYMWSGPVSCDGKLTLVYLDDTFLADYTSGTITSIDINFSDTTTGPVAGVTNAIKFHATRGLFTDAVINRGKTYVELDVTFDAVANTTDVGTSGGYSTCQLSLTNAVASY